MQKRKLQSTQNICHSAAKTGEEQKGHNLNDKLQHSVASTQMQQLKNH